jgi:hemolysin activation/secretion protein
MPRRSRSAPWLAVLLATLSRLACAAEASPAVPSGEDLERANAVIGRITIEADDIFDTAIKGENSWLYRTANKLHISTREAVIRDQLLFKTGQPFRLRVVRETERILRANVYLYDAAIVPIAWDGHTVDLEVRTRDNWTLNPGINFSRQGGENRGAVQVEEKNLLGTGRGMKFDWAKNVDRESLTVSYSDPHFLSTWTTFAVAYSDADDGDTKNLRIDRPFYALDTRHALGLYAYDSLRTDPRYDMGHKIGEFQHRQEYYEAYGGWSSGWKGGWVTRYTSGITVQQDRFALLPDVAPGGPLPGDRELAYPWLGFELIEDRFEERINQDQIERTEDILVGMRAGGRVGYASDALGSDRDAWVFSGFVQDGADLRAGESLFGTATASGRLEGGTLRDGVLAAEARYYRRTSKNFKFFATANGTVTKDLDAESQLLLGGDNGLRGYPLRYQAGTASALLTLEERYYTGWYPFRLFHVAAAVFFDMGRTWGEDITGATSMGLLKDVGVGLRLGSSRSAFGNVLHVDLAFPLDGDDSIDAVQLLVQTKGRF